MLKDHTKEQVCAVLQEIYHRRGYFVLFTTAPVRLGTCSADPSLEWRTREYFPEQQFSLIAATTIEDAMEQENMMRELGLDREWPMNTKGYFYRAVTD